MDNGAMGTVFYFLLWGGLIYLMMRIGCGTHIGGHRKPGNKSAGAGGETQQLRWVPPGKDVDPVCGKTVHPAKALSSVYDGLVYYFCSRECRERFETAPDIYLSQGAQGAVLQGEQS